MQRVLTALAVTLLLAGCGRTETASFLLSGADMALTLERNKNNFWDDTWQLDLVVRNNPECQRRHALKDAADSNFKVEVYASAPGVFILRQNKRWYVTEVKSCRLQQFKEEPPDPGVLVGNFQAKAGVLAFEPVKTDDEAAAPKTP